MNVLVFRTNMACEGCKRTVGQALNELDESLRWKADLEDWEKILRVETATVSASDIIKRMSDVGFICEELL